MLSFFHTPAFLFLFVSRHNAALSQCCCLVSLSPSRAKVPGEEIDPIVVIKESEEKEVARKEEAKKRKGWSE